MAANDTFKHTAYGSISTFAIMSAIGILLFFGLLHRKLKKSDNPDAEETFIFSKIAYTMLFALFCASIADSVFKISLNGKYEICGITFYGGLAGGLSAILFQLTVSDMPTQYTKREWIDILTQPLILFHICGRIGCFFAGCCYGKPTNCFLGVGLPDNEIAGIFHYGQKCYPTQLFEVIALIAILICVKKVRKKFDAYIVLYAIARFIIEFFRGDYRGNIFTFLSPAQTVSAIIIITFIVIRIKNRKENKT